MTLPSPPEPVEAVMTHVDAVPLGRQTSAHRLGQTDLVVDHEHAHIDIVRHVHADVDAAPENSSQPFSGGSKARPATVGAGT